MSMPAEKSKTSRGLVATLAIAFLLLSVAVLSIASIIEMVFNFQTQQEVIAGKQQLIAQEAANEVASFIQEKFGILRTAVKLDTPLSVVQPEQKETLENLLGLDRAFRQLVLFDSQNQAVAKVSRVSQAAVEQLINRVEGDLFTQTEQGNRYISSVYIDELTSEPLVMIAVPAADVFGDIKGTLLVEVNLKFMWDLVNKLAIGQTGQAYVVDKQGNLIAFGDIARVLRRENVSYLKEVGEFIKSTKSTDENGASISTGINGTTIVGTYVPLGTPDWAVVTELPVSEAYQSVIQSIAISVGIMVLMAIMAWLIGAYMARRLAAPLLNLTETAIQITEGKLNLAASVKGPTEVTQLANAFNSMTAQLRELIDSLEQRVAGRTQRLEIVANLGERLSAILNLDELLIEVVNQIKARFDYYHAHIYLLDAQGKRLVVAAGTGEAGQAMKEAGHNIPLNTPTSLVARAARSGEIVLVDNVREAEDWLPNPLLPNTYSEIAVPIILDEQVVGVLDVQEDEITGFDEGDANLLRSLANQVAVAIRNARLFQQVQTALAETRTSHEQYLERGWQKARTAAKSGQYHYTRPDALPLDETILAEVRQQALTQKQPTVITLDHYDELEKEQSYPEQPLVAPIAVRKKTIGALQLYPATAGQQWTEDDLVIITAVVDQLAQSAESLRLFDETRQRASREQIVREITDKLRQAPTLEELAKTASEELSKALGVSHSVVRVGVRETQPLAKNEAAQSENGNSEILGEQ